MPTINLIIAGFILAFNFQLVSADEGVGKFVEPPAIRDIEISPDGEHLALLIPLEGRNVLSIVKTQSLEPVNVIRFASTKQIGSFYWANDERLILRLDYFVSWYAQPTSAGEWYAVNIDGKKRENIFGFRASKGSSSKIKTHDAGDIRGYGTIVDLLKNDKRNILMAATPFSRSGDKRTNLYKVNIYNGRSKLLDTSPVENATYQTDLNGEVRFVVGSTKDLLEKVFYRANNKADWQLFEQSGFEDGSLVPLAFKDENSIYVADNTDSNFVSINLLDLKSGNKTLIYRDQESDPTSYWYSEKTGELYSVEYETRKPKYVHLSNDNNNAARLRSMLGAFKGEQVRIISQTRDEKLSVIATFSDRNPGDFYLFDADKNQVRFLVSANPKIEPQEMAEMQPIEVTARDGTQLFGYISLPKNTDKLPPLIVNPHGGPIGPRDSWEFNGETQLLVEAGFAVMQINFRGSGGYGKAILNGGLKTWGSVIQHDIIDATKSVVDRGLVNGERICIYGGSFGGYSALMAPLVEPSLFKCAIGFVGVYDLPFLYESGDIPLRKSGIRFLERAIGRDMEQLRSFSPVYRASELDLPIMIIHGEEDPRAPVEHAYAMMQALDAANKPYRKLLFAKEGHGLYNPEARNDMYQQMIAFFSEHLM